MTGLNIHPESTPTRIEKESNGSFTLHVKKKSGGEEAIEGLDTVLMATGRSPNTQNMNLEQVCLPLLVLGATALCIRQILDPLCRKALRVPSALLPLICFMGCGFHCSLCQVTLLHAAVWHPGNNFQVSAIPGRWTEWTVVSESEYGKGLLICHVFHQALCLGREEKPTSKVFESASFDVGVSSCLKDCVW